MEISFLTMYRHYLAQIIIINASNLIDKYSGFLFLLKLRFDIVPIIFNLAVIHRIHLRFMILTDKHKK
jgi:hypothetical protein